jgi:hypothetical protein
VKLTQTILGILIGTISIISLAHRLWQVGLAPVAEQIISYYRWFASIAKQYLLDWWLRYLFDFTVPHWAFDLGAIWIVCVFANIRSVRNNDWGWSHGKTPWRRLFEQDRLFVALLGPVGTIYFAIRYVAEIIYRGSVTLRKIENLSSQVRHFAVQVLVLLAPFFGAAIFFAWNAIVLSPQGG